MQTFFGYLIIFCYIVLFYGIFIFINQKHKDNNHTILNYIFAEKNIPTYMLTTSIASSWIWVTTIIGSAEACIMYGITGGIGYAIGATISFILFIPIILSIQKYTSKTVSFLDFSGERYSLHVKNIYYALAILVSAYVAIEQAAGIGFVFHGIFGTSYKKLAFLSMIICVIFLIYTGMRGVLYQDFINFFIIVIGFYTFITLLFLKLDFPTLYQGLMDVKNNPSNINFQPDILNIAYGAGIQYFFMSIIIALGQLLFDPSYYVKSYIAKGCKSVIRAFIIAGIFIWCPISILSSLTLGLASVSMHIDFTDSLNKSTDIATKMLIQLDDHLLMILFAILIFSIGLTTIIHYLIGIQSMFTLDFYKEKLKEDATCEEKILFGRVIIILIGLVCALIAISLENISLLTIDMFSGVFFAAPCSGLIIGIFSKKDFKNLPIISIIFGLFAGFTLIFLMKDTSVSGWFFGTLVSFFVPFLFLVICSPFCKKIGN